MKNFKYLTILIAGLFLAAGFARANVVLDNPAPGEHCVPLDVKFEWSYDGSGGKAIAENGYDFILSESPMLTNPLEDGAGLPTGEVVTNKLEYNTVYWWRATIHFTDLTLEQSSGSFTTNGPNDMVSPPDGAICIDYSAPVFQWETVDGASGYNIYIATSNTFGASQVHTANISNGASSTYTAPALSENTEYFWRMDVEYTSLCGSSSTFSETWGFSTEADPPALALPMNNADCIIDGTVFGWAQVSGVAYYEMQISESSTFTQNPDLTDLSSNTFTMSVGDSHNDITNWETDYWWRVRGVFTDNCKTSWSSSRKFTTAPAKPGILAPFDGAQGVGLEPTIAWSFTGSPNTFDIDVSADPEFNTTLYTVTGYTPTSATTTSYDLDDPNKPLQEKTEYFWRVRANYPGCQTNWAYASFYTYYEKVQLISPLEDEECIGMPDEFRWQPVPGATSYRLQISENSNLSNPDVNMNGIEGVTYIASVNKGKTTYYWRVRAEDEDTYGLWSETRTFESTVDPPELTAPVDGSTGFDSKITLMWNEITGTAKYDVQVSTDSEFTNPFVDEESLIEPELEITLPDFFQTYYWRVKQRALGCESGWSEAFSFFAGLEAPELVSPENNSTKLPVVPNFRWKPVKGASAYQFELSPDGDFSLSNLLMGTEVSVEAITPSLVLEENENYFWRVKAKNSRGEGPWSATFTFTTGNKPPVTPEKISPEDQSMEQPLDVTLVWESVENADYYRVIVATNDLLINPIVDQVNITDTTYDLTELNSFTEYFWNVQAYSVTGSSPLGPVWMFKTVIAPPGGRPELERPFNGIDGIPTDVTFVWNFVVRGQTYELQVATAPTFEAEEIVYEKTGITDKFFPVNGLLEENNEYFWRVRARNNGGVGEWSEIWSFTTGNTSVEEEMKQLYQLSVTPNPFVEKAIVNFTLPKFENVSVKVYDMLGQEVQVLLGGDYLAPGTYSYSWAPDNATEGMYFYVVEIGGFRMVEKAVLNK